MFHRPSPRCLYSDAAAACLATKRHKKRVMEHHSHHPRNYTQHIVILRTFTPDPDPVDGSISLQESRRGFPALLFDWSINLYQTLWIRGRMVWSNNHSPFVHNQQPVSHHQKLEKFAIWWDEMRRNAHRPCPLNFVPPSVNPHSPQTLLRTC